MQLKVLSFLKKPLELSGLVIWFGVGFFFVCFIDVVGLFVLISTIPPSSRQSRKLEMGMIEIITTYDKSIHILSVCHYY